MAQAKKSGPKAGKSAANNARGKKGAANAPQAGGSNRAFYILVIIILITVIVLLLNRYADRGVFRLPAFKTDRFVDDGKKEKKDEKSEPAKAAEQKKDDNPAVKDQKNTADNKAPADKEIAIYLLMLDEKTERIFLSQVKRKVKTENILESALESLIKGPTSDERNRGYITAVPSSLKVRGVSINGRTAEIDFSGSIEESAAGDIVLKRVQQIVYTATQFDSVDSVIIMINGRRRKTLGSDGFSISGPLRR